MIKGEEVVLNLKNLSKVLDSAIRKFPDANLVFRMQLSQILEVKEGSHYQLEIS